MTGVFRAAPLRRAAAAVALLAAPFAGAAAAAQDTPGSEVARADIEVRDDLIAEQESLLNVYRCRFGVDADVVPGGCSGGRPSRWPTAPGVFEGAPTAHDVVVRDRLIADQEALLNVYRCRFGADTELVPGGCADGEPAAESDGQPGRAAVDVLDALAVEPEYGGSGYVRADFDHDRAYLCDQAGSDPYTGIAYTPATCDVDHIVAAQEAFESGAWAWDTARRRAFGNHAANLTATRSMDCLSVLLDRSKGARDIAEWSGRIGSGTCEGTVTTAEGRCFLAAKTVQV